MCASSTTTHPSTATVLDATVDGLPPFLSWRCRVLVLSICEVQYTSVSSTAMLEASENGGARAGVDRHRHAAALGDAREVPVELRRPSRSEPLVDGERVGAVQVLDQHRDRRCPDGGVSAVARRCVARAGVGRGHGGVHGRRRRGRDRAPTVGGGGWGWRRRPPPARTRRPPQRRTTPQTHSHFRDPRYLLRETDLSRRDLAHALHEAVDLRRTC